MTKQGFIFDLESLVQTDKLWATAQNATVDAFGGTWSTELARLLDGLSLTAMTVLLADAANVEDDELPDVRDGVLTSFDDEVRAGKLRIHPGALSLLKQLRDQRLPIAIVSPMPKAQVTLCLARTGLRPCVDAVYSGEPGFPTELHDAATARLGMNPHTSIAIEHRASGVRAAQAAGLFTLADPTVTDAIGAHGQLQAYWHRDVAAILKAAALPRARSTAVVTNR